MKYGFLDKRPLPNSLLSRADPRAKLILFFSAAVFAASETPERLRVLPFYAGLIVLLAAAGRVSPKAFALRCLPAVPFIATAAALPLAAAAFGSQETSEAFALATITLGRASASLALLVLMTLTSNISDLLWALRRLKAPTILAALPTLTYRYVFVLLDEWRRVVQARRCRAPRPRDPLWKLYALHLGMVFARSWERSERLHWAMAARGFDGTLPVRGVGRFGWSDAALLVSGLLAFGGVRLLA